MCLFECVVLSVCCFLDVGSLSVGCVRLIAPDVGSCRYLLLVVGRGGCGILVVSIPDSLGFTGWYGWGMCSVKVWWWPRVCGVCLSEFF